MSATPQETIIQVLQALNIGTLIPSAIVIALMWKLYGYFNDLSEKLTRVELKLDSLNDLLPYKIKECVEELDKKEKVTIPKHPKHNPNIDWVDWVEIIGVALGLVDFVLFFALVYDTSLTVDYLIRIIFLAFIPAIFGIFPIIISKRKINRKIRALLSLISLTPWIFIVLVLSNII